MGKHAKFNREEVIEKATNLYWEKGFHATSMRNLQDVVDMRPGSIYATFGSKENLFREAIRYYSNNSKSRLKEAYAKTGSPLQALQHFVSVAVLGGTKSAPSGMCMLVKTVAELTEEHADLRNEAKQSLADVESEFSRLIKMAIEQGELSSSQAPLKLAKYLQVQVIGLRTYLSINPGDLCAEQLVNELFETCPFNM